METRDGCCELLSCRAGGLTMYFVSQPLALILVACGECVVAPAASLLTPELPFVHSAILITCISSPARNVSWSDACMVSKCCRRISCLHRAIWPYIMSLCRQGKQELCLILSMPLCFVICPVSLVLHPTGEGCFAPAMALVQAPVASVAVTICAGVHPLPMPHVPESPTLQELN